MTENTKMKKTLIAERIMLDIGHRVSLLTHLLLNSPEAYNASKVHIWGFLEDLNITVTVPAGDVHKILWGMEELGYRPMRMFNNKFAIPFECCEGTYQALLEESDFVDGPRIKVSPPHDMSLDNLGVWMALNN